MKTITSLIAILLTAFGLAFTGWQFRRGVTQYRFDQRWRRKEYVAKEYDRLTSDRCAALALQMLDWDVRSLPLLLDDSGKAIIVRVDRNMLGRALIPHTVPSRPSWGNEEAAIKDCMDVLLERLGTFEIMISEKLIEEADIRPYLDYWVNLISDPSSRSDPGVIRNLWLYIEFYGFDRAAKFVARFGRSIEPRPSDMGDLERECREGLWSKLSGPPLPAPLLSPSA